MHNNIYHSIFVSVLFGDIVAWTEGTNVLLGFLAKPSVEHAWTGTVSVLNKIKQSSDYDDIHLYD